MFFDGFIVGTQDVVTRVSPSLDTGLEYSSYGRFHPSNISSWSADKCSSGRSLGRSETIRIKFRHDTDIGQVQAYRKGPSCSNSEGAGGAPQGGNLNPFKSDPFHNRICSDFRSSLFETGSFNFRGRLRISCFGGLGGFTFPAPDFEALMFSALRTRSLHFESRYFL